MDAVQNSEPPFDFGPLWMFQWSQLDLGGNRRELEEPPAHAGWVGFEQWLGFAKVPTPSKMANNSAPRRRQAAPVVVEEEASNQAA